MNTAIVGRLETQLGKRIIFNLATNEQLMGAIKRNYLGNEDMLSSMRYIEDYKVDSALDAVDPEDAVLKSQRPEEFKRTLGYVDKPGGI